MDQHKRHQYPISEQLFIDLFNQYWEKMYSVCYHFTKDLEPSREMVQDIFRSLWEKRNDLFISVPIEHYLIRAAKLKACEYIRNKVNSENHLALWQDNNCNSSYCTEENVMYRELSHHVDLLVDTLSCQCQKVYKMSQQQGMSNKEIASSLLISEKTVSYHLVKAKELIQNKISALYSEDFSSKH